MTDEPISQEDLVYFITASPDYLRDGICFAGRQSGLYRSDDGGNTWRFIYDSLKPQAPLPTTSIALSPNFATDKSLFAGVAGGVLRSYDGGINWLIAELPPPPPLVVCLVESPNYSEDGTLLAGTLEDGVFCSVDRGNRWNTWNFGLLDLRILAMAISPDFINDETVFVGTETGIFRSTNGGRAWRESGFPSDLAPVIGMVLSPDYQQDGTLFAGTESNGLYVSKDRGRTWNRLGQGIISPEVNAIILSPQFADNADMLILQNEALLISHDGGRSWSDWKTDKDMNQSLTAVAAPLGFGREAYLLVSQADGSIVKY